MAVAADLARPAAPSLVNRFLSRLAATPEITGFVILIAASIGFSMLSPAFLTARNLQNLLIIVPELGLVTLGIAVLIICGEFDLSVGSVFALSPMITILAFATGTPFLFAVLLGIVGAALVGFANGWITLRFAIPSFITTLGTLFAVRSITVILSGGFPPPYPDDMPTAVFVANFGAFRASLLWFAVIAIVLSMVLHRTNIGNWMFATGGQAQAAKDMGIPVDRVKIGCFMLCSILAGFAGIVQTFRIESPLPSAGEGIELQAIAAAVIGGVALAGGIGSIVGALIGALLIRIIDNGLVMSRIDANWFKFALGALTIGSVILNGAVQRFAIRLRRRG